MIGDTCPSPVLQLMHTCWLPPGQACARTMSCEAPRLTHSREEEASFSFSFRQNLRIHSSSQSSDYSPHPDSARSPASSANKILSLKVIWMNCGVRSMTTSTELRMRGVTFRRVPAACTELLFQSQTINFSSPARLSAMTSKHSSLCACMAAENMHPQRQESRDQLSFLLLSPDVDRQRTAQ